VNSTAPTPPKDAELWTIRALVARHKLAAWVAAAAVAVLLSMTLVAVFGAKAGAVSDSTTCTTWGSANQQQQNTYAKLYLREHGSLPNGKTSPASVVAAINTACTQAYTDDVSDTTSVIQALSGQF
jgi:hypothetical protein